jgi:hypothetical protein
MGKFAGMVAWGKGIWFAREWVNPSLDGEWLTQVVNPSLPVPSIAWEWLDGWKIREKVS